MNEFHPIGSRIIHGLRRWIFALAVATLPLAGPALAANDTAHHKISFVQAAPNVRLEVLDWGGSGPPLIFLAGFGNTAHNFDSFAPRFTSEYHVYGITRRGFGASSKPAPTLSNYDPDRLADDVIQVIQSLHLHGPILVGHSIAGEELSSIGTRHPDVVRGLIYLDAADYYAFRNPRTDSLYVTAPEVARELQSIPALNPTQARQTIGHIDAELPALHRALQSYLKLLDKEPDLPAAELNSPSRLVQNAVIGSMRKYAAVNVPMLAIFAVPHSCPPGCEPSKVKAAAARENAQADYVASINPKARIVRIQDANHFVWETNGPEVERQMKEFMASLH